MNPLNSLTDRKWGAAALLAAKLAKVATVTTVVAPVTLVTLVTLGILGTPARASAQSSSASVQPPQPPAGTVTLPLAEYNRLLDRSSATIAGREDPPVPAVISRAEIDLRVNNGAARATIGLAGEVFRSGPTDVPLISGGTLIDAQLTSSTSTVTRPPGSAAPRGGAPGGGAAGDDGRTLPLVYTSGRYKAILPGSASFVLALTWGTTTLTEPGRAGLMLPAVHAGSVRASVDLPGEIADVRMQNGAITTRSVNAGRTRLEMTLDPGKATLVSWSSRETNDQTVRREVRLLSDAKTILTIGEADERLATLFDVTVVQGDPTRFDVRVPAGFELTSVSGPSVEESTVRDGIVSLTVREPARRRHQFLITFERSIAGPIETASASASAGANASAGAAARVSANTTASAGPNAGAGDSAGVAASAAVVADAPGESPSFAQGVPSLRRVPLPWLDGVQREMGEVAIEGVGTMELAAEEKGALHRIDASELNGTLQTMAREAVLAAFKYQRRTAEAVTVELKVTRFPDSAVLAAVADRAVVTTLVTHQGRALTEVTMTVRNQGQPFMKVGLPQGATLLSAEVAGVSVKPVLGSDGARVPLLRPGFRPPGGNPNGPSGGGSYQVSFVYLESGEAFAKKGDARLTLARVDLPISLLEWELFLPEGFQVKRFEGDVLPQQLVASTLMPVMSDGVAGVAGGMVGAVDRIYTRLDAAGDKPATNEAVTVEERNRPGAPLAAPPPPQSAAPQQAQSNIGSVNVQNLQRKISGVLPVRIDVPRAGQSHMFVRPVVINEDTTVRFTYRARS
jgi:hypothetical protein